MIVTDFHPTASTAGLKRTFRHGDAVHELVTYSHAADELIAAGRLAGLTLRRQGEALVGPAVREIYAQAGRLELYDRLVGQPMVLGLAFNRDA